MSHTRLKAGGGTISGSEGLSRGLWTSMSGFTPSLGSKATKTTTNPAAGTSLPLHIVASHKIPRADRDASYPRQVSHQWTLRPLGLLGRWDDVRSDKERAGNMGREAGSENIPEDEDDGAYRLAQGEDKEF